MLEIKRVQDRDQMPTPHIKIANVNWPESYPDKPLVEFAIAHTGTQILLSYRVDEESALGLTTRNNGPVYTDSCVEFFISFDERGYYNFEFNCVGAMLLGFRKIRAEFEHASEEVIGLITRLSSLGVVPFEEKPTPEGWTLFAQIPVEAFFKHEITSLDGIRARGNFFKCGDRLARPHFLSWQPISTPKPDFHREEFFGELHFE